MKNFILGIVCGIILLCSAAAYADVQSIVGKVVDGAFPVFIEGKKISVDALTIEGTSYLPVRAVGETLGYDVGFSNFEITLTKPKQVIPKVVEEVHKMIERESTKEETLRSLTFQIQDTITEIGGIKQFIGARKDNGNNDVGDLQQKLTLLETQLEQLQQKKAELEK